VQDALVEGFDRGGFGGHDRSLRRGLEVPVIIYS